MKTRTALILACLCATPCFADTPSNVTLILENDAGMVTQVSDLTQRECDGVLALLAARKVTGLFITGGSVTLGQAYGYSEPSKPPATSKLTKSRCVVPSDKP